ncbi:MAG: hypothetical protein K6G85_06680 [Eubacterium sp.]|nr:hypothetical protein [Eubacterium sp.]
MVKLLEFKEKLKNFYAEHEIYMRPILKFIILFVALVTIKLQFDIKNVVSSWVIILGMSVVFAFLPWALIVAGVMAVVILDILSLSLELAALVFMLISIMMILFFRFAPEQGLFLVLVPVAFFLKIPYIIPLTAGLLFAPTAVVSVTFGTLIYYLISVISKHKEALSNISLGESTTTGSFAVVNLLTHNIEMYLVMVAFAVTILVVYFVRRLSINNAWPIAIISGGVLDFVLMLVGSFVLKLDYSNMQLIVGTVVSLILTYILHFFVFSVDYSRTEHTQFEDDEYYYYVKAVPKINVIAPEMNVKRINAQRKKKNMPKTK